MSWIQARTSVAIVVGLAVAGGALLLAPPSYADDRVVVRGTDFPDPLTAKLGFVGCVDLYQRRAERLEPMIGQGPGEAPLGERSLSFDLAGGNAVGALYPVGSMLSTTTASLDVNAGSAARGVAYAVYQAPADATTTLVWLGRAPLTTPGGGWHTVEASTRPYSWAHYDMATGRQVGPGPAQPQRVASFAADHGGDGAGVYAIGFGCDGTPFSMDALRVGSPGAVTTYDVEGLATTVTIAADSDPSGVRPGDEVRLSGRLAVDGPGPLAHATTVLEERRPGGDWGPVEVTAVEDGALSATVRPEHDTEYRWRFVDRPLAEGSVSEPVLVSMRPPTPTSPMSPEVSLGP